MAKDSSSNLDPKMASALAYLPFVGWLAAIVFLIIEKDPQVRFDSVQSLLLSLVVGGIGFILGLTLILAILSPFVFLAGLVLNCVLAYKAYSGVKVELPVLGNLSKQVLAKISKK